MRKGIWITTAVAVGALLIPSAVSAATGTFAATTTRAGVTSTSSTSQPGVRSTATSTAGKGVQGIASRIGDYTTYGVVGQSKSSGDNATGVLGSATATSGLTNGVWGKAVSPDGFGVFGSSPGVGVFGAGAYGIGSFGNLGLDGDGAFVEFAYNTNGNDISGSFSGQCSILGTGVATSATCPFPYDLSPTVPIVVVTPTSDPGSYYWVSNTTSAGFDVNVIVDPAADLTFNYHVVALMPPPPLPASPASSGRLTRFPQHP